MGGYSPEAVQAGLNPDAHRRAGNAGAGPFRDRRRSDDAHEREQTPEDIGKLAAFLASDDAKNITGQAINVDGGIRMN